MNFVPVCLQYSTSILLANFFPDDTSPRQESDILLTIVEASFNYLLYYSEDIRARERWVVVWDIHCRSVDLTSFGVVMSHDSCIKLRNFLLNIVWGCDRTPLGEIFQRR